ncbi:LamG-like jellyroll fold domain-containing protein [Occultella kanbiaonis]|uniref:LamG-like jellyroll fold domain-containing protein n=1 Tax=Occultella kanbiaonis TaxID=2675754 RepID=UPI0012B82A7E|nr:LamG-like jellyroll fold domain-containing protein [Occultella kanbiaonis]
MRPTRIRATGILAAATLLAASVLAGPASADPTPDPAGDCSPAQTADDAAAQAAQCQADVEVLTERSPWDTVYATPEGTFRLDTSISALRTDINGTWETIDTTLTDTGTGISVLAPVHQMTFSNGTPGQPLAVISTGEQTLTMDAPLPLTTPTIEGATITYPDVLPDVDLVLQVHPDGTGYSEVLRVHTPEAAENPELAQLQFGVDTTGDLTVVEQAGGFAAQDSTGQDIFVSPTPLMWDSASTAPGHDAAEMAGIASLGGNDSAQQSPPMLEPAEGDNVVQMPTTVADQTVTIEPDQAMLANPDTIWPVYIDPTVSGSQSGRTIVRSGFPSDNYYYNWSGDQGLGYCSTGCTNNGIYRMLFGFGGLSSIAAADSADIISATFKVYGQHSWSCTPTGVQLWRTGGISASTTWGTQPAWSQQLQAQNLVHKTGCTGLPRWVEWNATAAAQYAATNNQATITLGLRTANETTMAASWQRYRHDAQLSVTYSRMPTTGTALATTPATTCTSGNPTYIRTTTPQFRWNVADPDGGNVTGNLDIYRMTNGVALAWNPTVATQASGTQFSITPPAGVLADGQTYEWQAGGIDVPTGRFGPVTKCWFRIDTTAPGPTTLTPTADEATYSENQISGGVGLRGSFNIANAAADIAYYKYSWNSDALDQQTTGTTISVRPTTPGSHRILVQAVDRAGNTGPVATYRFSVHFPGTAAHWSLDDATGTTGQDAAGTNDLTTSATTTWGNGMLADVAGITTDRALYFDSTTDSATSVGPAANTGSSYTVMAFVNLSSLTTTPQTAISQNGQTTSAFLVGQLPAAACGAVAQPCWFLQVKSADVESGNYTRLTSSIPATTDEWVHLSAIVDTVNNQLSLYVCYPEAGTQPQLAGTTPLINPITWAAGGPIELGRSLDYGATTFTNHWNGAIDHVSILDNVVPINTIRDACWRV